MNWFKGSNWSLDDHRIHGKFRVLYPDGELSQPFSKLVAMDYCKIFGGQVVNKNYKSHSSAPIKDGATT